MIGVRLGPYVLERELGAGGMGTVYLARGPAGPVALKVIHPHLLGAPGMFKRFLREGELGTRVRHPNVVATLDVDAVELDGRLCHFMAMEYVEGRTLRDLLSEVGRLPEGLCRHVGCDVARGLAAIHAAGAVHRDLKPENVLVTADHAIKVMDLGVARMTDEQVRLSAAGGFVGSLLYAAPEQFHDGGRDVDARTDLHALGLTLYELATGVNPFRADEVPEVMRRVLSEVPRRVGELNPQLSPFLEELIHKLLSKDRAQRFDSAEALAAVLDQGEASDWWQARAQELRSLTRQPLRRIRIPRETALIGREAPLARLRALYEKAKAGEGQVVFIEGEAGIGKTRLVDEFAGLLHQEGEELNYLFGSYPPGGAATASGAFATAYREQLGAEGLEAALAPYLHASPVLAGAFAALLRGEPTPALAEPLTKDSLQTCFVHVTRALAAERTTLVLIDDLHFAPEEGRALFAACALAVPGHRLLLVGTARPGLPPRWLSDVDRVGGVTQIPLPRLGPKDLVRLLTETLRSERLAAELAGQVALKSDGNPFFVFEILRSLREGRRLERAADGSWVSTDGVLEIEVPASIQELVQARIADLEDGDRALLEVAACQGFEFDALLAGDVVGMPRIPLLMTLGRIERTHRLIRAVGTRFAFDHHQVQESLYAGLSPLVSQELHAALGEALEARAGAATRDAGLLDGVLCAELCQHFLKGGRGERARRYLPTALLHLERGYLNATAISLARDALSRPGLLEGAERLDVLLHLAGRLELLGRREEERAALDEALPLADRLGSPALRARARLRLGIHLRLGFDNRAAEAVLTEAAALARAAGDEATEAEVLLNLGNVLILDARLDAAREPLDQSRVIVRRRGDRQVEAAVMSSLARLWHLQGEPAGTGETVEGALRFAQASGNRRVAAIATGNLGVHLQAQGRLAEAQEQYERHLALAREIGDRRGETTATGNLGRIQLAQGRLAAGRESLLACLALARETSDPRAEARTLPTLADAARCLGRPDEARQLLARGLALAREIRYALAEGLCLNNLAECGGDLARAGSMEALLREAIAVLDASGDRMSGASPRATLGALLGRAGRRQEAVALLRTARDDAASSGSQARAIVAGAYLAELVPAELPAVEALLERAAGRLEPAAELEARLALHRVQHKRAHLERVRCLLSDLLAANPDDRESMLAHVPLLRGAALAVSLAAGSAAPGSEAHA